MPEEYVEKTGWEILLDFAKGTEAQVRQSATPVMQAVKGLTEKLRIAYNPLSLSPGDIVLLDVEGALDMRFVVDRLILMRRTIGDGITYDSIGIE